MRGFAITLRYMMQPELKHYAAGVLAFGVPADIDAQPSLPTAEAAGMMKSRDSRCKRFDHRVATRNGFNPDSQSRMASRRNASMQ